MQPWYLNTMKESTTTYKLVHMEYKNLIIWVCWIFKKRIWKLPMSLLATAGPHRKVVHVNKRATQKRMRVLFLISAIIKTALLLLIFSWCCPSLNVSFQHRCLFSLDVFLLWTYISSTGVYKEERMHNDSCPFNIFRINGFFLVLV